MKCKKESSVEVEKSNRDIEEMKVDQHRMQKSTEQLGKEIVVMGRNMETS